MEDKIGIGVLSFRRPDYLQRCLESLSINSEIDRAVVYVFQDGAVNRRSGIRYAPDSDIERSVQIFEEVNLPNKELILQDGNVGPAAGVAAMFIDQFARGHSYITMMANDMEVSPFYVKTHRVVRDQFMNDTSIGVLRTGPSEAPFRRGPIYSQAEAEELDNKLCLGYYMMQDFGTWRRGWEAFREDIEFYYEHTTACDWRKVADYTWAGRTDVNNEHFKAIQQRFGAFPEDVVHVRAAKRAGLQGLHTVTPRITGFGEHSALREGYHKAWPTFGMEKISLWGAGRADHYEIIDCTSLGIPRGMAGEPSDPQSRAAPSGDAEMIFIGVQTSPFTIRGDKSGHTYDRIRKGRPFVVKAEDVAFFEKNEFRRT